MYTAASLSQPESLKQHDEDSVYESSFSLSQPNISHHSPMVSPNHSPILSHLKESNHSFSNALSLDQKFNNYFVSPAGTPRTTSPELNNKNNFYYTNNNPSSNYYPLSPDYPGKRKNSNERRGRKRSVVHALENIIEPNHQGDPVPKEDNHLKYDRKFKDFHLQNGHKRKVIYEGQFNRWIEEDPFSIYSDDVIRFSTKPSSTVEQRNDLSFERIVSQHTNGYWQKNNFLITGNEIVLFPNANWESHVIEVMAITDDINISISSILIAKLEWIIEVKTSESNVYTQSNFNNQVFKSLKNKKMDNPSDHDDVTIGSTSTVKDTKSSEKDSTKTPHSSNPSRQIKWILRFYDRESMLYFISLIKYIQTKKIKKLVNEEEWDSIESDVSSDGEFYSSKESSSHLTMNVKPTIKTNLVTSPPLNNLGSPTKLKENGLGSPTKVKEFGLGSPPRQERTTSLERLYNTLGDRKAPLKTTNAISCSPVLETEDEHMDSIQNNSFQRLERQHSYNRNQKSKEKRTHLSQNKKITYRKNSETTINDVDDLLKDSIRKAEFEITKLQSRGKKNPNSGKKEEEQNDKMSNPTFSSPKTNWKSSKNTKYMFSNPYSSSAIFTNIQLSYLDMLENKAKNKVIKLNNKKNTVATPEKNTPIQVKVTDTEKIGTGPATEEDTKPENSMKKMYPKPSPQHRRDNSFTKFTMMKDNELANGKNHPVPYSSPTSKFNAMESSLPDPHSGKILRRGSGKSGGSGFYSPRSSSLFIDDIGALQKRISLVTNISNNSANSDVLPRMNQKSLPYNDSDHPTIHRNSFQSNVSTRVSVDSSEHAGHSTTKSTPDNTQISATTLRNNTMEGNDMSLPPPLNDVIVPPKRSASFHNLSNYNNITNNEASSQVTPSTTTNSSSVEGRPRSGSKSIISSLFRSNSARVRFGNNTNNNNNSKATTMTPHDNNNNNSSIKGMNSGGEMNKNEAFPTPGTIKSPTRIIPPYMTDLKSSNDLYLASLQQHFKQQPNTNPMTPLLLDNLPQSNELSSPTATNTNRNVSKPLQLKYRDAKNQLKIVELNDESIIPISFLKNYPKKKPTIVDPIILNSIKILNILEQTYI